MTVTLAGRPAAEVPAQRYAGTGILLRFALRRDRRRLAIWVLSLGGLTVYTAIGLGALYPTAADRQGRAAVIGTPAGVLLSGPGYGTGDYTLGAMIANELALTVMVAAAIMSVQLVVRQTRAEEESGRAELVRAAVVGRRGALTAALLETALADAAIALVLAAGLSGSGLAPVDSLALATAIGVTALLFGAVAAVTAQLSTHTRAATGAALAVLAVAVVVRGVGDMLHEHGSPLSWVSPVAWAQQTRPFVDLRWSPLLLSLATVAVLVFLAYRLVAGRDLDSGLVAPRPGPAGAARSLSGVLGLDLRLQRASTIGWAAALLLTGVMFGSLARQVAGMVAGNARLAAALGADGLHDVTAGFFVVAAQYLGVAAAAFAVASLLRTRAEEGAGRTEIVLAAAVDRRRYLGGGLVVTVAASVALLVVAGLGTGVAAAAATGDGGLIGSELGAQLVRLPAVLLLSGLTVTLLGLAPRLGPLAWLPLTWAVIVASFGPLLDLPMWARDLSPFAWIPQVPDRPVDWPPLAVLTLIAAGLAALGLVGYRRRDVPA